MKTSETGHRLKTCNACGALSRRASARFCLVCGSLLTDGYQPLQTFRASYLTREGALLTNRADESPQPLFEESRNGAADSARALVAYALVPFLGIAFVPAAVFAGACGVIAARRSPQLGGERRSVLSVAASLVVLAVQLFLWWALIKIPELGAIR